MSKSLPKAPSKRSRPTSAHRTPTSPRATTLILGSGTQLISFDNLYAHFAPFGYTPRSFLLFLRALGCAPLHPPSGPPLINLLSLQLAINAATRIGQPDFFSPGHPYKDKPSKLPKRHATKLSPTYFQENWQALIAELLTARELSYSTSSPKTKHAFQSAASKISAQLSRLTRDSIPHPTPLPSHISPPFPHLSDA